MLGKYAARMVAQGRPASVVPQLEGAHHKSCFSFLSELRTLVIRGKPPSAAAGEAAGELEAPSSSSSLETELEEQGDEWSECLSRLGQAQGRLAQGVSLSVLSKKLCFFEKPRGRGTPLSSCLSDVVLLGLLLVWLACYIQGSC